MENKYFDTDMVLNQPPQLHTFTLRAKINTNNLIEIVTKSQELQLVKRYWLRKQQINSLYGWCCSVRHGKSKRVKEMLSSK